MVLSFLIIQDKIIMYNIILDYNENSTAQYMYKQAVIYTHNIIKQAVSNTVHSQHDTARQYRTCIADSDMASVLIRSLYIKQNCDGTARVLVGAELRYLFFSPRLST